MAGRVLAAASVGARVPAATPAIAVAASLGMRCGGAVRVRERGYDAASMESVLILFRVTALS
jgi:hypothetical protein